MSALRPLVSRSLLVLALPLLVGADGRPPYRDASLPVEARVRDLLGRMTLEEKVAQLGSVWGQKAQFQDEKGVFDSIKAKKVLPNGIGQVSRPSEVWTSGGPWRTPQEAVAYVNAVQKFLIEETRLGIPAMFHEEAVHGFAAPGGTHFPVPIALAATWDVDLLERVMSVAAREARARGVQQVLAPVIDLARDPRWGRTEETYGEDPYLTTRLGVAAIRGYQGPVLPLGPGRVLATAKHFAGHGPHEGGINTAPRLSRRAHPARGIPAAVRGRGEGGRGGGGDALLQRDRRRALAQEPLPPRAGAAARVGVRRARGRGLLRGAAAPGAARRGERRGRRGAAGAPRGGRHRAARRPHLRDAREAGPRRSRRRGRGRPRRGAGAAREVSLRRLRAALRGCRGSGPRHEHCRAPGAGPGGGAQGDHPAEERKGSASPRPREAQDARRHRPQREGRAPRRLQRGSGRGVDVLTGIQEAAGAGVRVVHAEGTRITEHEANFATWYKDEVVAGDPTKNRQRIAEAAKVARGADVIVLVLGGNESTSREAWGDTHLGDTSTLDLLGQQDELVEAVAQARKPMVAVLLNGRPHSITKLAARVPAILECFYLGQEGGTAVGEVLFGAVNPSGKLPISIPRDVGQLPVHHGRKPTSYRNYLFASREPLYSFGHGLSYTTFAVSDVKVEPAVIAPAGRARVTARVANTGSRAGETVVQLYLRDAVSSVTRPVRELAGFSRVALAAGEAKTVALEVGPEALAVLDEDLRRVVEPGTFAILVGTGHSDLSKVILEVRP